MKTMLQELTFEIKESPVLYDHNGQVITSDSHKVIAKENGNMLSVMKNSYNPMFNKDFTESVNRMQDVSGFNVEGYTEMDGGRIILAHLKNNGEFEIKGNKIEDYLVMGSSFDGRYPFFIGTTTKVIWCQNQFSKISKLEKVRHTKSAPKKREELMVGLEIYFQNKRKIYENFESMIKVEVDEEVVKMAQDYILNVSKGDRLDGKISTRKTNQLQLLDNAMLIELEHFGMNMFGIFNGATRYSTHSINQKEQSFGNIFGTVATINDRAYQFATSF